MQKLMELVLDQLKKGAVEELYPAFDAVPYPTKSETLFVVAAPERIQLEAPFVCHSTAVHPFTADIRISVLIPMTSHISRAEDMLYQKILPQMERLCAVLCEVSAPQVDVKLGRVVLAGVFRMRGLYSDDREVTA